MTDMRRISFECAHGEHGQFARILLTAWPTANDVLDPRQWWERIARYYGLPSPVCVPIVGRPIQWRKRSGAIATGNVLDEYGGALERAQIPGDGWRVKHDTVKYSIGASALAVGAEVTIEVFNLFADLFSAADLENIDVNGA